MKVWLMTLTWLAVLVVGATVYGYVCFRVFCYLEKRRRARPRTEKTT